MPSSTTYCRNACDIVGTSEWIESRKTTNNLTSGSVYECNPENIPKNNARVNVNAKGYIALEKKMMNNGWMLCDSTQGSGETYFAHNKYRDMNVVAYVGRVGSVRFTVPIVNMEEDEEGLGCSFTLYPGTGFADVVSNEWHSYWDTRKGRRRERYLSYLDAREEKRKGIEEEEAKFKKNKKMN